MLLGAIDPLEKLLADLASLAPAAAESITISDAGTPEGTIKKRIMVVNNALVLIATFDFEPSIDTRYWTNILTRFSDGDPIRYEEAMALSHDLPLLFVKAIQSTLDKPMKAKPSAKPLPPPPPAERPVPRPQLLVTHFTPEEEIRARLATVQAYIGVIGEMIGEMNANPEADHLRLVRGKIFQDGAADVINFFRTHCPGEHADIIADLHSLATNDLPLAKRKTLSSRMRSAYENRYKSFLTGWGKTQ